jgi:hypothetical protein
LSTARILAAGTTAGGKRIWAALALIASLWCSPALAQCPPVIDEPGADICTPSYPDNFVPFSAAFQGFGFGCSGTEPAVGIGYPSHPYVTFRETTGVEVGNPIYVSYTGWASGSTGSIEIAVSVSADNATWYPCGVASGRDFLGNSTADVIHCGSPIDAAALHVRLETVTLSPALVFLRTITVQVCCRAGVVGELEFCRSLCKERKAKETGKRLLGVLQAFGKNVKISNLGKFSSDISKAQSKFTKGFTKAEFSGAGVSRSCETIEDADDIESKADFFVQEMLNDLVFP